MKNISNQQGFSLIEVLIGMLILTIGILGMASMQISAKRLGYDALQRSIATSLSHDIVERMRSNRFVLGSYVTTGGFPSGIGGGQVSVPANNCVSGDCTDVQLAALDLYQWEQALDGASEVSSDGNSVGGLVTPRACITNTDGLVRVAIAWDGYQKLGNPPGSTCGAGQNLYGVDDEERQLIEFTTFINTEE